MRNAPFRSWVSPGLAAPGLERHVSLLGRSRRQGHPPARPTDKAVRIVIPAERRQTSDLNVSVLAADENARVRWGRRDRLPIHGRGSGSGIQWVGRRISSPVTRSNQVPRARTANVHSPFGGEYTNTGSGDLGAVSMGNARGRRSETPGSLTLLATFFTLHPSGWQQDRKSPGWG